MKKRKEWAVGTKRQEGGSEMGTERPMSHDTAAEEDRPEIERGEKRKEEKHETAEERGQMEEAANVGGSVRNSQREGSGLC